MGPLMPWLDVIVELEISKLLSVDMKAGSVFLKQIAEEIYHAADFTSGLLYPRNIQSSCW